ncbi:S9 family peptidase [soil metagenome]
MPAQLARKITAEDIHQFRLVADPQVSPHGQKVAYSVTTIEKEKNDYRSSIFVSAIDGSHQRRLTTADAKDSRPAWSPDGSQLAFLSNRSEKPQIWIIRADGGEAWKASDLDEGVNSFEWSPDGSSFVAVSKSIEKHEMEKDESTEEEKSDVKHITRIRYKADGEGFLDFKPKHLWIIPVGDGKPRQLTHADISDGDPVWSPSGREIAFVTNRSEGREWNSVSEIWVVPASGGDERPVISGDTAAFGSPSWSPDGSKIAVVGHWEAQAGGGPNQNIWTVPAGGGEATNLTADYDRSMSDFAMSDIYTGSATRPIWTPDGEYVMLTVSDTGSTQIYSIPSSGGEPHKITSGDQRVSAFSLGSDGKTVAFIAGTVTDPGNIYVSTEGGNNPTKITALNDEFLNGIALSEPEEFWVASQSDGQQIQCWVMKPVGFQPGVKYPMILEIHGGPHGMYSNSFMHEFQLMAARGYVVVYTNPRGSQGYGEAFTRYTHMAWGEKDMPDIMAAVDHVLEQGYVDESRVGITGGSYGGFMTLWMIGHSDRFKAAVTQRCVSNLYSFFGTSDIGWGFGGYNFGGTPWENRETFMKYSPITYVKEMTTPLLIVHSEQDFRCPIEQGEQVFISLKKLGREVEFVRFPDENHNLSRSGQPKHRIERLEYIIGWFDRYM